MIYAFLYFMIAVVMYIVFEDLFKDTDGNLLPFAAIAWPITLILLMISQLKKVSKR